MLKILTVIGARPQIIKAAALSREINKNFKTKIQEYILHTGQHYDENMSEVFFKEMGIPSPAYNLGVGSASHGRQTAEMIAKIEEILINDKFNAIVLYGDTNSTLAGAIAASKINIPVVHIEAGLRSYNKQMPEEINRIMCDHVSTLLFCPTTTGVENLAKEGFNLNAQPPYHLDNPAVFHCGDIMYDNSLHFAQLAEQKSAVMQQYNLKTDKFVLATIHRNHNTDTPERLSAIFEAMVNLGHKYELSFVLPLHPRTNKMLPQNLSPELHNSVLNSKYITITPPVSFFDMIALEKHAKMVFTDSGGVQKEAFFFKKPCIILRPESEWVEIVENGNAKLVDADKNKIYQAFDHFMTHPNLTYPPVFGDGNAANFMCNKMIELL